MKRSKEKLPVQDYTGSKVLITDTSTTTETREPGGSGIIKECYNVISRVYCLK